MFATFGGLLYSSNWNFFFAQAFGSLVVVCWACIMGYIVFKGLNTVHGLRVPTCIEEEGLDIYEHEETAYNN